MDKRKYSNFLTDEMIDSIRKDYAAGLKGKALAEKYEINNSTVSEIVNFRNSYWKRGKKTKLTTLQNETFFYQRGIAYHRNK